ncbi:MAG: type II secretion system F family protein [Clostridiales bacterium]|nr:type II secretion system F family protein [Clostridiales bacterium]
MDYSYLSYFCAEFSMILKAGIQVSEGFSLLAANERDEGRRAVLEALHKQTDEGISVYEAMSGEGVFPPYMMQMIKIGEGTGYLDSVFSSLALYCESKLRIAGVIRSAVFYPAMLLVIMLAVLFVFLTQVLPIFSGVFSQLGVTMSPIALAFLNFGLALRSAHRWILGVICAIIAISLLVGLIPAWREAFSSWVTRVFSKTKLGHKIGIAHFASALELCFSGGVNLDEALELSQFFCRDPQVVKSIGRCRQSLLSGENLAAAFTKEKLFSPMSCQMLSVGVHTGTTDVVLKDIARRSADEMDRAVEHAVSAVEPTIIIFLSVCVGLLLLAVMLPLVGIMSAI